MRINSFENNHGQNLGKLVGKTDFLLTFILHNHCSLFHYIIYIIYIMNSRFGKFKLVKSELFQLVSVVAVFKGIYSHLETKVIYK